MPSRTAKIPHLAQFPYNDVELAIKELGTLWILNLINKTLSHTKEQKEKQRVNREK